MDYCLIHIVTLSGRCYYLLFSSSVKQETGVHNLTHITFPIKSRVGILTWRESDSKVYVINHNAILLPKELGGKNLARH